MRVIDTHCHLDFTQFENDRQQVIERAHQAGVGSIINVGTDLDSCRRCLDIADSFDNVYASVGVHPHYCQDLDETDWKALELLALKQKVVAIGEVGLDFMRSLTARERQQEVFDRFIRLSLKLSLPLIVHCRDSQDELLNMLKSAGSPLRAVIHCFCHDRDFLEACLDLGLFVSFTANITYPKNSFFKESLKILPTDRFFLETDAPFLSPESKRGSRNEPAFIMETLNFISLALNLSPQEVARITTENARNFFNIP